MKEQEVVQEANPTEEKLEVAQRLYGQRPRTETYLWNKKTRKTFPNGAKDRGPSWALRVALVRWEEKVQRLQRAMPLTATDWRPSQRTERLGCYQRS